MLIVIEEVCPCRKATRGIGRLPTCIAIRFFGANSDVVIRVLVDCLALCWNTGELSEKCHQICRGDAPTTRLPLTTGAPLNASLPTTRWHREPTGQAPR